MYFFSHPFPYRMDLFLHLHWQCSRVFDIGGSDQSWTGWRCRREIKSTLGFSFVFSFFFSRPWTQSYGRVIFNMEKKRKHIESTHDGKTRALGQWLSFLSNLPYRLSYSSRLFLFWKKKRGAHRTSYTHGYLLIIISYLNVFPSF